MLRKLLFSSVGFIALLGVAVLNGLVLVSHFNQLIDEGLPLERVVFEGAVRRLRPVLMTASIAAFGLVPLLFASGPGSEIQKPLAIVVIGGLVTSTALTLFLLPILFRRFGVTRKGVTAMSSWDLRFALPWRGQRRLCRVRPWLGMPRLAIAMLWRSRGLKRERW